MGAKAGFFFDNILTSFAVVKTDIKRNETINAKSIANP